MRSARKKYPGARYHIVNRGNGKQRIFYRAGDYLRFRDQLASALDKDQVVLYAYCLMPNHFHIFVETPFENIDRFMGRLTTSYAMYFRYKHYRPGHCFQGRYKSPLVEGDDYILRLMRYIHLNPVKMKDSRHLSADERTSKLLNYRWSSLQGYLDPEKQEPYVDYRWISLFGSRKKRFSEYRKYIAESISQDDEILEKAMSASSYAIGDDEFRQSVEEWVKGEAEVWRNSSDLDVPASPSVPMKRIEKAVEEVFGLDRNALRAPGRRLGSAKGVFVEIACTKSCATQRQVARYLGGISEHAVGKARSRMRSELENSPDLVGKLSAVERLMSSV